jgi:hypothetical protein
MPPFHFRMITAVLLAALSGSGRVAASEGEWSTSVSPAWVSASVFRGQQRGGMAVQTVVEAVRQDFGAGLWTSFPLEGSGGFVPGTEADLYVFHTLPLAEVATLVPGATLYTYPRADRLAGFRRATFEASLAVNATFAGVRFTPKVFHDFGLKATTLELAAVYALALPSLGTELDFSAAAGAYLRRDDAFGALAPTRAWGDYWQAGVSVPYQITARTRLIAGWTYAAGSGAFVKIGGTGRMADPRATRGGSVSLGFSTTF